jgi:hypothetical protein
MINIFEKKIEDYNKAVQNPINVFEVNNLFSELTNFSFVLYNNIQLPIIELVIFEIKSFYMPISLNQIEFQRNYEKNLIKFELLNSFLSRKNIEDLEISTYLKELSEFLYSKNRPYESNKIVSLLIFFTRKDETLVQLINYIFKNYSNNGEIDDETVFFEILTYINLFFNNTEIEQIKKRYGNNLDLNFLE